MNRLLVRASDRYLLRHPWQAILSILGIGLGVAVVLAVDLAGDSARRAFEIATRSVTGRATHHIVGGPAGLDEGLYLELRLEEGLRSAAPVIEEWVTFDGDAGRTLRLLGVDPFAERPFRSFFQPGAGGRGADPGVDLGDLLATPGGAVLSESTAQDLGVRVGGRFAVLHAGRPRDLVLVGLLRPDDELSRQALEGLLILDIATAQDILVRGGRLTRIDLVLDDGEEEAIRKRLPAGADLQRSGQRSERADQMVRAFRLNLEALSLLAVLCGAFLIYNTMTFSVLQRRELIGGLRTLGVTRREVFRTVLSEALVMGLVGSALGVVLGTVLARELVGQVTTTINDLYFVLQVQTLVAPPATLLKAMALGLGATLLAAMAPAHEATTAPPRAILARAELEAGARRSAPRLALLALVLLASGAALLWIAGRGLTGSFAGLFVVLLGCALMTPLVTLAVATVGRAPLGLLGGLLGRMAARSLAANLSRTGVAIAALMMAVAVTIGVSLMIGSFRSTVERWLRLSLPADVYVSVAGAPVRRLGGTGQGLDPDFLESLAATSGVDRVNTLRRVELVEGDEATMAVALGIDRRSHSAFDFKSGGGPGLWPDFHRGEAILVSEPYAYRRGLAVGDPLRLPGAARTFRIGGIFYDYAWDRGIVILDRAAYAREWGDPGVSAVSVFLDPGIDPEAFLAVVRGLAGEQRIEVRSERAVREESLEVFDRTFLITDVLRLLATVVAFIGVLSALMALQMERRREIGVLRALGLTPGQLWGLVTTQTGLMGLVAGLLAMPVGILMALMMIRVINRRSFGWTMPLEITSGALLQALALAVVAALLAGLYPAWRLSRTSPAAALREE